MIFDEIHLQILNYLKLLNLILWFYFCRKTIDHKISKNHLSTNPGSFFQGYHPIIQSIQLIYDPLLYLPQRIIAKDDFSLLHQLGNSAKHIVSAWITVMLHRKLFIKSYFQILNWFGVKCRAFSGLSE